MLLREFRLTDQQSVYIQQTSFLWNLCSFGFLTHTMNYIRKVIFTFCHDSFIPVKHSSINSSIPIKVVNETEQLLEIFIYGIPCRSPLLPKEVRNDTEVRKYPTQISTALCKVRFRQRYSPSCATGMKTVFRFLIEYSSSQERCPKNVVVEVIDKDGKVRETYNNSAGEYYAQQELPPNSVRVERVTMYAYEGKPFIIPCPRFCFACILIIGDIFERLIR